MWLPLIQARLHSDTDTGKLQLAAWTESDCTGLDGYSSFPHPDPLELNVSNGRVYQSIQLSRRLNAHEQLDLSVAFDLDTWYGNKDQYSANSASCAVFLRSFTALDDLTACIGVPKFTCHRLWANRGL